MLVLAADVGATTARILLAEIDHNNTIQPVKQSNYQSQNYSNLESIVQEFLSETQQDPKQIAANCFAVAGPIKDNKSTTTNLPWIIDTQKLGRKLDLCNITLINDFQAIGHGLTKLDPKDLHTLQPGSPEPNATKTIIGAGSGLGIGFMTRCNGKYIISATEGGHANFAPTNAIEIELLKYLMKKYPHVSVERLLSGPGIINIYEYLRTINPKQENPELRTALNDNPVAQKISEYAMQHQDPLAIQTIECFVNIFGALAGDLACNFLPYGGLYLAGGIASKLRTYFTADNFLRAFLNKGRLSNTLQRIPIYIVLDENIGLKGTAIAAQQQVYSKNLTQPTH